MNARALFPLGKRYKLLRRPTEAIMPSSPRPARRDCHGRLIAALLDRAGEDADVTDTILTPWASATFVGARHGMTLMLAGEDAAVRAEAMAALLPEAEFRIAGHLVADLSVDSVHAADSGKACLRLSILTIESW